jgi:hypothetical protein
LIFPDSNDNQYSGMAAIVTGWGYFNASNYSSPKLKTGSVSVFDNK